MTATKKVLVTNWSVLEAKYGSETVNVRAAIDGLIQADAGRGITTEFVALDDPGVSALGAIPVTVADNAQQCKDAVDAVYVAREPDALVILGSVDVIPRQPLRNPMPDRDALAQGDLPYACEHPFSEDAADFSKPTRVVGRLPDLTGMADAPAFTTVLDAAATWVASPAADYLPHLVIGAKVWDGSTKLTVQQLFGSPAVVESSPPGGPTWPDASVARRTHFFNCHGASADPRFYGQDGNNFPIAHDAASLAGHVTSGTVVSAECCYGAELYDPNDAGGALGICNAYLVAGALGFFGSSTIAYGPPDANANADLICRYFLAEVLKGSSLGEAALHARQSFVGAAKVLDPADLKTLAQFDLLGDPTVCPVLAPAQGPMTKAVTLAGSFLRAPLSYLERSTPVVRSLSSEVDSESLGLRILEFAGVPPDSQTSVASFSVDEGPTNTLMKMMPTRAATTRPTRLHVVVTGPEGDGRDVETVARTVAVVAEERDGDIVSWRTLFAR